MFASAKQYLTPEGRYQCTVCNNSYRYFKHLKRHNLHHTGERPFKCSVCGVRFARSDCLRRHINGCQAKRHPKYKEEALSDHDDDEGMSAYNPKSSFVDLPTTQRRNLLKDSRGDPTYKQHKSGKRYAGMRQSSSRLRSFYTSKNALVASNAQKNNMNYPPSRAQESSSCSRSKTTPATDISLKNIGRIKTKSNNGIQGRGTAGPGLELSDGENFLRFKDKYDGVTGLGISIPPCDASPPTPLTPESVHNHQHLQNTFGRPVSHSTQSHYSLRAVGSTAGSVQSSPHSSPASLSFALAEESNSAQIDRTFDSDDMNDLAKIESPINSTDSALYAKQNLSSQQQQQRTQLSLLTNTPSTCGFDENSASSMCNGDDFAEHPALNSVTTQSLDGSYICSSGREYASIYGFNHYDVQGSPARPLPEHAIDTSPQLRFGSTCSPSLSDPLFANPFGFSLSNKGENQAFASSTQGKSLVSAGHCVDSRQTSSDCYRMWQSHSYRSPNALLPKEYALVPAKPGDYHQEMPKFMYEQEF